MKPILVVGLGNTLVGDDGIGCRLVEMLMREGLLQHRADYVVGGSDLLRLSDLFEGRERVVLIDAVMSADEPGTVSVHEEPFEDLDPGRPHAHHPSAVQAVRLLKSTSPFIRDTTFTLIGITVPELRHRPLLSAKLPSIAERVRRALLSIGRRTALTQQIRGS